MGLFDKFKDKQENKAMKMLKKIAFKILLKFIIPPILILVLIASFWYIIGGKAVEKVSNVVRDNGININVTRNGRSYKIDESIAKKVNEELNNMSVTKDSIGLSDELLEKFYEAEIITSFPDLRKRNKIGDSIPKGEIQGCIQFKRNGEKLPLEYMDFTDFQDILAKFGYQLQDSEGNAPTIDQDEVYKTKQEVEKNYNDKLKDYFTLDEENNLIIASIGSTEITTTYNDYAKEEMQEDEYSYEYYVNIKKVNYQAEVEKYSMPIEFLISLLMISENSEFCEKVADLARESKIVIEIQDNLTTTETKEEFDFISRFYAIKQCEYEYEVEEIVRNQSVTNRRVVIRDDIDNDAQKPKEDNGQESTNQSENDNNSNNQNDENNQNNENTQTRIRIETVRAKKDGIYAKPRNSSNPYKKVITIIKSNSINLCTVEAKTWLLEAKAVYEKVNSPITETTTTVGLEYIEDKPDENGWIIINVPEEYKLDEYIDVPDYHNLLSELTHDNLPQGATKVEDSEYNDEYVKEKREENEETTVITTKTQEVKYTKVSSEVINQEEKFLSILRVNPLTNVFDKENTALNTKLIKYKDKYGQKSSPEDNILSATEALFSYLALSERSQAYEETMRYLLYIYTGRSYGVKDFDFSIYEAGDFSRIAYGSLYGNSIEEKVWFALKELGFNDIVVAGAMGNISYESGGFNPSAVEAGGTGEGIGLIQWSFGRREALENYAAERSLQKYGVEKELPWQDEDIQIEFLIAEISGEGPARDYATRRTSGYIKEEGQEYTATFADWANEKTIEDSTLAFMRFFESPKSRSSYNVRLAKARQYYDEFEGRENLGYSSNYYTSQQARTMVEWAESYVGKSVFYRPTDNYRYVSKKYCAAFAESAHCAAGFGFLGKNAIDIPHPNSIKYYPNGKVDYSLIPIGAYIVSRGTDIRYGHVALYVGNGYVIEAGGNTIVKNKIDESYGRGKFLGWGT